MVRCNMSELKRLSYTVRQGGVKFSSSMVIELHFAETSVCINRIIFNKE